MWDWYSRGVKDALEPIQKGRAAVGGGGGGGGKRTQKNLLAKNSPLF